MVDGGFVFAVEFLFELIGFFCFTIGTEVEDAEEAGPAADLDAISVVAVAEVFDGGVEVFSSFVSFAELSEIDHGAASAICLLVLLDEFLHRFFGFRAIRSPVFVGDLIEFFELSSFFVGVFVSILAHALSCFLFELSAIVRVDGLEFFCGRGAEHGGGDCASSCFFCDVFDVHFLLG